MTAEIARVRGRLILSIGEASVDIGTIDIDIPANLWLTANGRIQREREGR